MKLLKYIAFALFLISVSQSRAQESMRQYEAGMTYHYGYILAHRDNVKALVKDYTKILEVSLFKQGNGDKDWHVKYNYPYFGISTMFFDFGNPEQLGKGFSLMAFYNFPLIRKRNFEFLFKLGFGPGYIEKVFDRVENYGNIVVSTHWNGFAFGNFNMRYKIKNRIVASAGLSVSHFSNASASKPNLGVNIPALNAGVTYKFGEVEKSDRSAGYVYEYSKDWSHDVIFAFGRKRQTIGGDMYKVFDVAYSYSKLFGFKTRLGFGADMFYNESHKGFESEDGMILESNGDIFQGGLNIGYALNISDLNIFVNMGAYLYDQYKEDGPIYHRFGMRYLMYDHFILNLSMKTHWAVADHVEMGLGYRF
jgi:hypothetical protein